jgi:aspartate-semialdehyde dehydrogenase
MERLRREQPDAHDLGMDWALEGDEFDEEAKIREETRKILDLRWLPISANSVRVPVLVGHAEAIWVETEAKVTAESAERILADAPGVRIQPFATPARAAGDEDVLASRIREDTAAENGLALFVVCDNLLKGAALNAVQIAEQLFADGVSRARRRSRRRARA